VQNFGKSSKITAIYLKIETLRTENPRLTATSCTSSDHPSTTSSR